jgi:hypothetical protein
MKNEVPGGLKDQVLAMPEYRQGVNRVTVRLRDGTSYRNVFIAWGGEIVKVGDSTEVPFDASDIVAIENDP